MALSIGEAGSDADLHSANAARRDHRVETAARQALRHSPYQAVRQVTCIARDGALLLQGRVPNYHLKQMAQVLLKRCLADGMRIENQLDVQCA
jgi:hypothetical protein